MAKYTWYDGNQGFYRDRNFNDYDIDSSDSNGATLLYDVGGFDPTRSAWRIELTFSDATEHVFEQGPDAGDSTFTSGTISGISYYSNTGDLLLDVTGLKMDLAHVAGMLRTEGLDNYGWNLGRLMQQGDNTYIGSNDSMNLSDEWDGDSITTGYGNDLVKAKGGDDYISDLLGKDKYIGGSGWDTVSYEESHWNPEFVKQGIKVDLANKKIVGYDGMVDTVSSIEDVRGTFKKDSFIGDKNDNSFMGYRGNDKIDGGKGWDRVDYRNDERYGGTDGIVADLSQGFVRDGFGNRDKIKNIEAARGTDADDVFVDNSSGNSFDGRDGDDLFTFGKGDDWARGGSGADTFRFKSKFDFDTIDDFEDGTDRIQIAGVVGFGDLTLSQDGDAAIIEVTALGDGHQLRLENFDISDLSGADFIFGAFV